MSDDPLDTRDPMVMSNQCTAMSKQAKRRCKQPAIPGGTVCRFHGGAAPQVRQAAKDRIAALVDPAIDALQRALDHKDVNAAVRAARDLLDRAGLAPPQQKQVEHSGGVSLLDSLRRIEAKEDAARGR